MKRILFVDDEPQILDGLRDSLRKQRKHWDMVFAVGGEAALAELERGRFDVVVSDMRMPKMDGATLLQKVKERCPSTVRIILSGHAEREAVINALPVVHQFLRKPCDVEALRDVVERACALQALISDEGLRSMIGKINRLPSAPRTYWAITHAAARPDVALAEIAAIIEQDPSMAAKVLQLVNSSYFGLARRQTSVTQAVGYLGIELVKALTLSAHVFGSAAPAVPGFSLEALQAHSMLVARVARKLLDDKQRAAEACTAAMVHDLGKLVLAMAVPDRVGELTRCARETGRPDHVVERELLGLTHAEVGAVLLGVWGLPLAVVEAVAFHHQPELAAPTDALVAVHVANALSHQAPGSASDPSVGGRLNVAFVEASGFGSVLSRWRGIAEEELRAASHESGP